MRDWPCDAEVMAVMYGRNGRYGRFPRHAVVETALSLHWGGNQAGLKATWVDKGNSDWVSDFEGDGLQAVRKYRKVITALAAEGLRRT